MICKYCVNTIDDNAKFCPHCGNPVEPFIPAEPAAPGVPSYPAENPAPQQNYDSVQPSAPYAPAQTYPPQQPAYAPVYAPAQKTNGLAIAGFVCSIAGALLPSIGFILLIVGLVLSIIGLTQIKKTGEKGRGLAIAGIIISCIAFLLGILLVAFFFLALREAAPYIYDEFEELLPYFDSYLTAVFHP